MSDEIKRDKSPNCPRISLEDAIDLARKLLSKLGKAAVKQEVAAGPLGYSGINGASLGTIAALSSYQLIDKERGGTLRVSNTALQILHPQSVSAGKAATQAAAKGPKVFATLLAEGFQHSDEGVIANHLVHMNFTPDTAKKVASVFLKNVKFADLANPEVESDAPNTSVTADLEKDSSGTSESPIDPSRGRVSSEIGQMPPSVGVPQSTTRGLAELPIPLDNGLVARVPYPMSEETFELLMGTLQLWKKRLIAPSNTNPL